MRISSALRVSFAAASLLLSCAVAAAAGTTISGADAEKLIDAQVVQVLRGYDSSLVISAPSCPKVLTFSSGTIRYCSVTINGAQNKVPITFDASSGRFFVPFSSFYEMDRVERMQALQLSDAASTVAIHCGAPRFRLLLVGTVFSCAVAGDPKTTTVKFRAEANGAIFMFNSPGHGTPKWITDALAAHEAGKPTIVDGPTVTKWLTDLFRYNAAATGEPANVTVACPPTLDVSGTKHALCRVSTKGFTLRQDVYIDPTVGFHSQSLDTLIDLAKVQRVAQANFNQYLHKEGVTGDGIVQCSTGMIFLTPPATFNCAAKGGGQSYQVEVSVPDSSGRATWQFIQSDTSVTPDPASTPPPPSPSPQPTKSP